MIWRYARLSIVGLMALILAATSLTMAVARGQTRVAGEIVICTGYGMTTITVDANGQPTGPVHLCPDMVLGMMAALDTPPPTFTRPEGLVERVEAPEPVLAAAQSAPDSRARGPPLAV
ncbi:hypothetical protein [Pseudothioclava nitratireducens]|uniref:hypothetical protein n=1 Tax=Pseudothioclava nitratireducens TaxID=1928646 RepID=UPI0023DC2C59|nr:hypothetical protein [Defluviimonas nitratireducens]MDF1620933.1 hypothetical protein [Defluviimonas nitratireducens]